MRYPRRRFERPIFIQPAGFTWSAVTGEPGVAHRVLSHFGDRTVGLEQIKLAAGTRHRLDGSRSVFVQHGGGRLEVAAHGVQYERYDTLHLSGGEEATIATEGDTELLVFLQPCFDEQVETGSTDDALPAEVHAEDAEV
ncbi:MAG: hypothetical protein EXR27_12365 [Betaproteobacteria bacterium]|nr:hypothetical protein [Betaproteobacteria bacterium]